MPAEQIARNLAFVNWTLLAGLAVGSFGAVVLLRLRTEATKGYLGFTALCAAAFGALAWLSDGALPAAAAAGSPVTVDPAFEVPRRVLLGLFAAGALAYAVVLFRAGRAAPLALAATGAGAGALVLGALTWGGGAAGVAALAVQLFALAAATGGVFAAMILGHWYLVTPKLSTVPALLLARVMTGVVALQLSLFGLWVGLGIGTGQAPLEPLTGPWALFVWLRLVVSLVLPLVVSWAAVQTVRTRSMESATGLLYINVGLIAAGTIVAAGLYFGAGLLV
ncbi:MAG TPA: hypothetical protein VER83_02720 [Candidatus Nanopelagicales bacterium]|nr:hypothetical protein [Candidatus Nanopelagicales bacterium]